VAEIKVPEMAESINEGTLAKWLKQVGDPIRKGEPIAELETDKVNVDILSETTGVIRKYFFEEGDTVKVGDVIAIVEEEIREPGSTEIIKPEKSAAPIPEPPDTERISIHPFSGKATFHPVASPAARKLARLKGIDLSQIKPLDPLGRIRKQDLEHFSGKKDPASAKAASPTAHVSGMDEGSAKPVERIRMSRRRQTIARRLLEVKQTTAMLTTFNEIDMSAVMDIRKRRKDAFFEEHQIRLGFMSFFTKAVVAALKAYPMLNAEIRGDEIIVKKYYDIGVAVSTDEGLVVPVVREADKKNFAEIEQEIAALAKKARDNKLELKDLQGGTFTITNGGVFGSLMSTPILNGPQTGILGMHKIQYRPIALDSERMEIRPMMYVALSYDHRIIDGKEAVGFLVKVKELLEDPEQFLLES
jgi:2-oxoglutarate dehydrogenase E2 component (EC 2.3.1.61)